MRVAMALATLLCVAQAVPGARAQEVAATARTEAGEAVVLFGDGTWRFSDEGGVRCTAIGKRGELCALPSVWYPVPNAEPDPWPVFRQTPTIRGQARVMLSPYGRRLETEEILASIGNEVFYDGLQPMIIERAEIVLAGRPGTRLVTSGGGRVHAYSFAECGLAVVIIRTSEWNTTLNSREHREAHASLANAVTFTDCQ